MDDNGFAEEDDYPSGTQYLISKNNTSATIASVGATIRSFTLNGQSYLDETPIDEMVQRARGQMLIPWPNRVADGRYNLREDSFQLPINEVELNNSIHGLVRWQEFQLMSRESDRLVLRYHLAPTPGWPFSLEITITFQIFDALLKVRVHCRNKSRVSAPVAFGSHPYLKIPNATIANCSLCIPARKVWLVDAHKNPKTLVDVTEAKSTPAKDGSDGEVEDLDFRTPRRLSDTYLDFAFTDLISSASDEIMNALSENFSGNFNRSYITDGATEVGVVFDENFTHVQAYFDSNKAGNDSIAIEPMTAPPNAFNLEIEDHLLGAKESRTFEWGIYVDQRRLTKQPQE